MNTVNASDNIYDFESEENSAKWKGVLITALKRVSTVKNRTELNQLSPLI